MKRDDIIILIVCWGLVAIFMFYALSINAQTHKKRTETHEAALIEYITEYFDGLYPSRQYRALTYIPHILDASRKHQIEPLLIAVVISHESGWRYQARGKLGEVGLMQIRHNGKIEPKDNINRGAEILRMYLNKCGTVLQALSAYQHKGICRPVISSAKRRYREYMRVKR